MKFLLDIPGHETDQIVIVGSGFIRGPRLLVNGQPVKKGPRNQYALRDQQRLPTIVEVSPRFFLDPIPYVSVNGEEVVLAKKLTVFQIIWSSLPMLLVFVGGLIGGFLGAAAAWFNARIFRAKDISEFEKYILSGIVTLISAAIWAGVLFMMAWVADNSP